jgi:hypothetical protein
MRSPIFCDWNFLGDDFLDFGVEFRYKPSCSLCVIDFPFLLCGNAHTELRRQVRADCVRDDGTVGNELGVLGFEIL